MGITMDETSVAGTMAGMANGSWDRILAWLPNHVGDVVMATPALRTLRETFRAARIVYVGRPVALDVVRGTPWADELIPDVSTQGPLWRSSRRLVQTIRDHECELGVLFPNSFRTAMLARLGRVGEIVGYARDRRSLFLNRRLIPLRDDAGKFVPVPTIDYYLQLLTAVGIEPVSRQMELPVTPGSEKQAEDMLAWAAVAPGDTVVMLNPGAAYGSSKLWPPERFAAVADHLIESRNARIVINAAPSERDIARRVVASMRTNRALNLGEIENSLPLLRSLVRRCTLLITNDTGARHVAAAFDVPVVTIFGSTDPRWAQIDHPKEQMIRVELPCSPCQEKVCPLPQGNGHHQCMRSVPLDAVIAAAEYLLDTFPPRRGLPQ